MALTIGDDGITSDRTAHTARSLADDHHGWEVSWLPGRSMDRNSAITAMALADVTGPGDLPDDDPLWIHVEGWGAELGLNVADVLTRTADSSRQPNAPGGALQAGREAVE